MGTIVSRSNKLKPISGIYNLPDEHNQHETLTQTGLFYLPDEVAALILNRLSIPQIVFCLPRVCKQFKEMCLNYNYRESLMLDDGGRFNDSISGFLNQLKETMDFIYVERSIINPGFDKNLFSEEIVSHCIDNTRQLAKHPQRIHSIIVERASPRNPIVAFFSDSKFRIDFTLFVARFANLTALMLRKVPIDISLRNCIRDLGLKSLHLDQCSVIQDSRGCLDLHDFKTLENLHIILKAKISFDLTLPSHLKQLTVYASRSSAKQMLRLIALHCTVLKRL
jgi:hypothetical protein